MAEPLSFAPDLDDEQKAVARKVFDRAIEMGVDPRLALSVAYQESRLRPNVNKSHKGALGIMQVMPRTGKEFGFSKDDLLDTDKNIEAGVTILKKHLDDFPDDPRLAVVAYNAGPNSAFFKGGNLPKETENYLKSLQSYGAFTTPAEEPVAEEPEEPVESFDWQSMNAPPPPEQQSGIDEQEIRQAQLYGGGAGAGMTAFRSGKELAGSAVESLAQRAAEGAQRATAPQPILGGAKPPTGPLGAPQAPYVGGPQAVRGTAVENYGKAFGLGDIEAGRALDMTKQPGGVHDLTTQRREALNKLKGMAPAIGMAEDATRGGLMVPQQTPYTGPRGPQGQIGGAKPPPVSPVTPPPASALEDVTSLLRRLATTPIMRYLAPPVAGALSVGELARSAQQMRGEKPDYTGAGLSAAGGLGGVMSLFPATAPIGIPLGIGAGALQYGRNRMKENEALGRGPEVVPQNPMGDYGF
ncbi:MAG: lytic transglycosylase domain-containing protein [Candidatus Planktophila sp.]|nr:lytic transglycosylase domain-containing protein [Candidatus Planktophila sp.]